MANHENLDQRFAGELLVPVGDDIEQSGAGQCAENQPRAKVNDDVRRHPSLYGAAARGPKPKQESDGHEDAVPVDRKTTKFECNAMHVGGRYPRPGLNSTVLQAIYLAGTFKASGAAFAEPGGTGGGVIL